tara:strand:+ start:71 stop:214 length:144 start_codon:yes stop_codon:yes gene_type:complete
MPLGLLKVWRWFWPIPVEPDHPPEVVEADWKRIWKELAPLRLVEEFG